MSIFKRKSKPTASREPSGKVVYRNYAAAKLDRLTAGWTGVTASPDSATRQSLTRIRGRSRQQAVDNPYMKRFFQLLRSNVVGAAGFGFQNRAVERENKDGITYDDAANRIIESGWREWSKKGICTVDGRSSLIDVLQMLVETAAKDGEIIVRKIKGKAAGNDFGFAVQLIEADHLDENYNSTNTTGNKIRQSIEYNAFNRPVAYHILNKHPGDLTVIGDGSTRYERFPANEIEHLYRMDRPAQSRGVPWAVSAMWRLNMLGGYEEAEVTAARTAAGKMGFFKTQDGAEYSGSDQDDNGGIITDAEAGAFELLPEGIDFVGWDPQHPASAFPDFVKAMLRGAASGMGVSYNSLANDLQGVNFSSIRQGALEERELWKMLQTWLTEHFLTPIFEEWLLMAMTTQKIPLPVDKFEKFNKPLWRPRGWGWVDPLKEVKSNIEAVNAGFMSAQDVASENGQDIEEVYAQLARESAMREKHGVTLGNPDMQGVDKILALENKDGTGDQA